MFDFAVPKLRERGVKKFLLEVLQVNEPAIKVYEKSGFCITREFDCLGLDRSTFSLDGPPKVSIEVRPVPQNQVTPFGEFADWQPSWENSFAAIARIPDEVIINGAFADGRPIGLLAYYPLLNWIMSLVVKKEYRRKGIATALLSDFVANFDGDVSQINLVNVERTDTAMLAFLERMGFKLYTSQYEMALDL
ncbi:MAG: GNAT family N-acetyltransferase [Candidatus Zixiibacteriota bacterium]|nr:MAG: GNAT family N-acetyltransferase [candidate division Zixibacteria bacterium]